MKGAPLCLSLVCALALAGIANAQDADSDKAAAEAAFLKGKDLMKAGKVEEACDAFGRSQKLDPQNGTAYNLALCDEKAGHLASAWTLFRQLAQTDTNAARRKDSDKHATALNPRLTKMLINVNFAAVPGIIITRNGEDVTASVGIESPVDPGDYTIVAAAAGYKSFTATVSAKGEGMTVTVSVPQLEKLPAEVVTPPPPPPTPDHHGDGDRLPPPPPARHDRGGGKSKVGLMIGAGGLVVAGGGLVFGALSSSKWSAAKDACGGDMVCDTQAQLDRAKSLQSTARTYGNVSTGMVIVGGAALATGVVLWLIAPSHHHAHPDADALQIAPVIGGGQVGFAIGGAL